MFLDEQDKFELLDQISLVVDGDDCDLTTEQQEALVDKSAKGRYWAFVGYEDSLPVNYIEILNMTGLPWARSPYHNKDINPTGENKKPHYHFIICWGGPTTFKAVKSLVVGRLHCPIPIMLQSPKGYFRYFTHKDNPEKHQYSEKDIKVYNGFDVGSFL